MKYPFDVSVDSDVDLKPYNTLNISVRARSFAAIKTVDQLQEILQSSDDLLQNILVLGGGSNVLFAGDYDGLVLHVEITGRTILQEDEEHVQLKIGAGEDWHRTVRYCVQQGWGGIENLSLIPGTVGAAPIQNIGAYGAEFQDVFEWLEAVNVETGAVRFFDKKECRFGYRDSIFKNELKGKYIVTNVVLKLSKKPELNVDYGAIQAMLDDRDIDEPTIRDISDIVIDIRNSKLPDPGTLGNAGSFFKNPIVEKETFDRLKSSYARIPGYPMNNGDGIKVPAAWLIEQAGWKGKVVGNTGTYKQQALVIVNHGGATGQEILELARAIQNSVNEQFGIELVPEVNIIS